MQPIQSKKLSEAHGPGPRSNRAYAAYLAGIEPIWNKLEVQEAEKEDYLSETKRKYGSGA